MLASFFGRKARKTRKPNKKSSAKKAPKSLRTRAHKYDVRTTHKVNGKRVPKDEKLLKKQIKAAKKRAEKKKLASKFSKKTVSLKNKRSKRRKKKTRSGIGASAARPFHTSKFLSYYKHV